MSKEDLSLEESKEVFLKFLSALRKEIKNADEFKFEIKKGMFDYPNSKTGWIEHCYDGKMDISIHVYNKKNDESEKHLKNYLLPKKK